MLDVTVEPCSTSTLESVGGGEHRLVGRRSGDTNAASAPILPLAGAAAHSLSAAGTDNRLEPLMAAIISLGIAVHDLVFAIPEIPTRPRKVTATRFTAYGGGMAATAAVAAARLGGHAAYWGRLGEDAAGDAMVAAMRDHGVDTTAIARAPGTRTAVSAVLVSPEGERLLAVYPGKLDDDARWLPLERVATVQAVMVDFRWLEGARLLLATARERGLPRVLDGDVGHPGALTALLPLVDHAVFSELGLAELTGESEPATGLRAVAATTTGIVAVTLGNQGSMFLIDGSLHAVAPFAVTARNTNGAGDVFHGAYTLALAEGQHPLGAARFASAAAALMCEAGESWDGTPRRPAVERLLTRSGQ
ncbi:MAG: PfkB family carbohydrate kinase [Casimicrobiaceae bacterium]